MKKIISLSLAFCFIFVPITVFAETTDLPDSYYEYFSVDYIFYETNNYSIETYLNENNQPLFVVGDSNIFFNGEIVHSYVGNPEILFFAVGDSIYRYHVDSKIVDLIITDEDLIWFYPITAYTILYAKGSADIDGIICSTETDDTLTYYYYNKLTNTANITTNPEHTISLTGYPGDYNILSINSRSSYIINGTSIPLNGYPIGSSFDDSFEGGTQCHGFGLYVYDAIWGSTNYGQQISRGSIPNSTIVKQYLQTLPNGSLIRFTNSVHTVILLNKSSTGITVYHANWPDNNLVTITTFTYENIASRWGNINYVKIPCSSHSLGSWTSEGASLHSKKCSSCGYKQTFGNHYAETAGYGTCLACGYVGYITIGTNKTIDVPK